jgi:hypothetical protein
MKPFGLLLGVLLLGIVMFGCSFSPDSTDNTIQVTTTTEEVYQGPYFKGLYLSKGLPLILSTPVHMPLGLKSQMDTTVEMNPYNEDSVMESFRGQLEYLVIDITQPQEVEDQYVISSITIQYPNGSKIKWTSATTEPNGTRKWYSNSSNTKFYIPYTTPNTPQLEGYVYQVTAIQYLDGTMNKDVRFEEQARDFVTLKVINKAPSIDGFLILGGSCPVLDTRVFSNVDSVPITSMFVNNVLVQEGNLTFQQESAITIPSCPLLSTDGWFKLGLSYDDGIGGTRLAEYLITTMVVTEIRIHTGADLMLIPKNFQGILTLMANITLPADFEPFRSGIFGIDSITGNETITIEGDAATFTLWQSRMEDHFLTEYFGFKIRLLLRIGGTNKPIVFENNNVSPAFLFSTLENQLLVLIHVDRKTLNEVGM